MALQKNPGPLLTSWFKGLVDHIPPEWRARLGLKKRDQQEPVDIDPDAIAGVLVNSEVAQTRTDERKKSDIELATDPTGVELHQQKRLANGQLVDEVRTFVPEGTPLAGVGVETIEAEQHNLGIGWMTNDVTDAALPGPTVESSEIDHDGVVVKVFKTRRLRSTITESEQLISGVWGKITTEGETDLVATEVIKSRTIPGVPMVRSRIDEDGAVLEVVITYKPKTPDTSTETIVSGFWVKVHQANCTSIMGDSILVIDEVVEGKPVPGQVLKSAVVDGDQEIQNIEVVFRDESLITPVSSEFGGFITTVEKKAITDIVAQQITTVTKWLDKAVYAQSIPDSIIPLEFRAQIPTVVESHVVAGIASMPTLVGSQISTEERQLTKNLKEVRNSSFGEDITFPIDQLGYELTEEYGGGVLVVQRRLHNILLTVDEGEDVVRSHVQPIGEALMWFRETARRYVDLEWPELVGTEVDPRTGIVVEIRRQVVNAGTLGGVDVNGYHDAKPIDKWRTLMISSKLQPGSLPAPRTWETTVEHSFPNTLNGLTWLWAWATGTLAYDFDSALVLDITQGYAGPCRALVTESFTNGPPATAVAITQFFPQGHMVGYSWAFAASTSTECDSCTDQVRAQAKTWTIPPALHDAIVIGGGVTISGGGITGTLPATDPIALPASGTLITKAVEVEPWRFNIFYRKMVQIYVP